MSGVSIPKQSIAERLQALASHKHRFAVWCCIATCVDLGIVERVVVFGTAGSGKSTLAQQLAKQQGLVYIPMDDLHWNPGWQSTPTPEFRAKVEAATIGPKWVTEGNYRAVRDIYLGRADTVVWLDYSFGLVFARLLRRTVQRVLTGQKICNGNRETFVGAFLSRNSLLWFAVKTHWRKKKEYPQLLAANPQLKVWRFTHPTQTHAWLQSLIDA